jgi:hypothetical protein
LISGVMTGVTAGAMGFIGAAIFIAGLRFAAFFFLAGFFFFAALRAGFRFFAAFFFDDFFADFFFATRFLDFFLAVFFLVDFLFFRSHGGLLCGPLSVVRVAPEGSKKNYQASDSHRADSMRNAVSVRIR